jgi:PhnB protein
LTFFPRRLFYSMTTKAIPEGYDSLIPALIVRDAARAIEFYREVFGAIELLRMPNSDGSKIAHAELKVRNSVLMLGDECPQMGAFAPPIEGSAPCSSIFLYVPGVDDVYQRAISCGAKVVMPPADMFWGDRMGKFIDPFGHQWGIATHIKDVSPEACAKAAAEWAAKPPA